MILEVPQPEEPILETLGETPVEHSMRRSYRKVHIFEQRGLARRNPSHIEVKVLITASAAVKLRLGMNTLLYQSLLRSLCQEGLLLEDKGSETDHPEKKYE